MRYLITLLILLLSFHVHGAIAIIVHPSNKNEITRSDLERIYTLRQFSYPDDTIAFPFMLPYSLAEREIFDQEVSGLSSSQLMVYWSKIVFSGKGTPPRSVTSATEMLNVVSRTPNAIGYVPAAYLNDVWLEKVTVVLTIE